MQIFNTMSRQKEEFVPRRRGEYRIYVCGPTVYNYIHIGNARPMIVFDTLRRYLNIAAIRSTMFPISPILTTSSSKRDRKRAPPCRRLPASLRPSTSRIPTV